MVRRRSVGLTAASVVYCGEFIVFSNKTKNTSLTFDTGFLRCFDRLGVVMLDDGEQGGDKTRIRVIHELSKQSTCDPVVKTHLYHSICHRTA